MSSHRLFGRIQRWRFAVAAIVLLRRRRRLPVRAQVAQQAALI